ncbi:hypothetical protein ACPPVS_08900 [Cellulomonas sp. McL0617]|uniref:hypothetical protein n=1 Tax=Cellulomonas sp. McL0617 TaxID=3415675 RepID=UPI003CE7E4E5
MAAFDNRLVGAAIAHGITPRAVATWNPALARTPRVMVPIQLDVLLVREEGGTWAKTAMTVPDPGSAPDAHTLLPDPFAERDPRKPGAYLHWALPDALTRGSGTAAGGDVSFPPVPDRWVVSRISTPQAGARRAVTAWVMETGGQEPVVEPLDSWTETADPERTDTPGVQPLTVLGHGDAAWSAYYDDVENRLGFYDDLSGATGPVAYLVTGWHSRHIDDPIGENLSSPTAFEARIAQLGWEINPADIESAFVYAQNRALAATTFGLATREATYVQKADAATGKSFAVQGVRDDTATLFAPGGKAVLGGWAARAVSWPELTLYHGGVVGLGWPGAGIAVAPDGLLGGDAGGPPAAEAVTVTIGSTLTEALAARLAQTTGAPDEARILEAVLLGAVDELDQPDAPARIDARLHASAFGSLPGGTRTEQVTQRALQTPTAEVPSPSSTDPGVFAGTGPATAPAAPTSRPVAATSSGAQVVAHVQKSPIEYASPAFAKGTYDAALTAVHLAVTANVRVPVPRSANADAQAETVDSERALPRYFMPADPVFLLEGAGRSFKHGSDGLHTETGTLVCRLSGHTTTSLAPSVLAQAGGAAVRGQDLLDRGLEHGGIPPECDDLLAELALLDPGSAPTAVRNPSGTARFARADAAANVDLEAQARVVATEQTAWWIARDERRDLSPLLAVSGLAGTLPSAIAVAPPVRPWVPLHLDWAVDLFRSPGFEDWQLEEVDFDAVPETVPAADAVPVQTLTGRALLSGGAASIAAATVRRVVEQARATAGSTQLTPGVTHAYYSKAAQEMLTQIAALSTVSVQQAPAAPGAGFPQRAADLRATKARAKAAVAVPPEAAADLDHVADELERMDVLVGAMDRFNSRLRGGFVADGTSGAGQAVPPAFWPLRSGFMRVTRLRLVDCFGQVLDLLGPDDGTPNDSADVLETETLVVDQRDDLVELAPRFTAPARLWFRFVSADDDATEADDTTSPVCGFVLPNHLDGDLQLYGADGGGLGAVRFDAAAGVVWEESPGQPSGLGGQPASIVRNPHLAGLAQGLLDWGAVDASPDAPATDSALSSLLRIVDASLWAVDPFGHIGEEHLALLVGHPLAVLRALVRVEVAEPVAPDVVAGMRVPVRLGALAHWQDGLLAYFVGDDYRTLRVPDPAAADFARPIGPHEGFNGQASTTSGYYDDFAQDLGVVADPGATPVDHPYVDTSGILWVQPGQDVMVTLLVEPHCVVHATTGFLPRKEIGMRRGWVAPGLARLAPVFRFGPVLVDPKLVRMPVASDIRGTWSWSHRSNATTWVDDPITNSVGDARIPPDPAQGQEGWLTLTPEEPQP